MPIYRLEKLFNEECESNDENDSAREDQIPVAGIWNTSLCSIKDCLVALLFCGAQGVVAECTLWVNGIHEANFLTEMSACLHQLPERRNLRHINTVLLFQILFSISSRIAQDTVDCSKHERKCCSEASVIMAPVA